MSDKLIHSEKTYTFLWLFFIAELVVFFLVAFFLFHPPLNPSSPQTQNTVYIAFLYFSYLSVIIAVPASYKIYDIKKKQARKKADAEQKAEIYFMTQLIIYAIFEFSAIITLIAYFLNKMYEPLYMFGIIFIALLLKKPSLKKFIEEKEAQTAFLLPEDETLENTENKYQEKNKHNTNT